MTFSKAVLICAALGQKADARHWDSLGQGRLRLGNPNCEFKGVLLDAHYPLAHELAVPVFFGNIVSVVIQPYIGMHSNILAPMSSIKS